MRQLLLQYKPNFLFRLVMIMTILSSFMTAFAYSPDKYAASSVLSSGKWAKVKVNTSGIQFIPNSQLVKLGFSSTDKVNVYGYGGRILPELLSESMPDDLPLLPVVRTTNGIYFFGTDHFRWSPASGTSNMKWKHEQNPYSEDSFFFLSDREIEPLQMETADLQPPSNFGGSVKNYFTARDVHETDIFIAHTSGRKLFGEDFRSPSTRSFSFSTPDNLTGDVNTRIMFGHLTSAASRLKVTSNGKLSGGVETSSLSAATSSSLFMMSTPSERSFSGISDKLDLTINFTGGGTISLARLDFIEVEWNRELKLLDGQLYFYDNARSSTCYDISGCSSSTQIWDVTNPEKPIEIKYTLSGSTASFISSGYHEFVAFDATAGYSVENAGSVANQDIHSLPTPDMVIISPKEFSDAANRVAEMRRKVDGYTVHVLTPQSIYNEFSSGSKDATAFRKMLKMWYDRGDNNNPTIKYCLLMGRPFYDQKHKTDRGQKLNYESLPAWQTTDEATETSSFSTDDYIGMVEDGGSYFQISTEKIKVAVGRFPVETTAEANQAAEKLIEYVENPILGSWRNDIMVIADDQDNGIHLEQAEDVVKGLKGNGNGNNFDYERLYLDSYPLEQTGVGAIYLQAQQKMFNKFNEGVIFVDYIGHANAVSWTHEHLMSWKDITSFTNKRLPFLLGATCNFGLWDADDKSGAEVMWLNPIGGIIGGMIATRTVFISSNGVLNSNFSRKVFERDRENKPKTFGSMMIEAKNDYLNDDNKLRFGFFGDPALRIPSPTHEIVLESIDNVEVSGITRPSDYPELMARQKVKIKGSVLNPDGSEASDFNGELSIKMWDAEKTITTYGNGDKGVVKDYNDRKTVLFRGATKIENGKWETEVRIPSEIENNYSPGRLSFYAYSESGIEANGHNENFYIYGYDTSAEDDSKGPDIKNFALNNTDFKDGGKIGTSAIVIAELSDESGINLSTAGIGHNLSLCLDNKKYYDDILNYYTPDPLDPNKGSISYPLKDLEAGQHTLTLVAWDNANNSSKAVLSFNSSVNLYPEITSLVSDCSPAKTDVTFSVTAEVPGAMSCIMEVLDLSGKTVWNDAMYSPSSSENTMRFRWNLCNISGVRVDRGIYIYRATVTSSNGAKTTKSSRIAVTAP